MKSNIVEKTVSSWYMLNEGFDFDKDDIDQDDEAVGMCIDTTVKDIEESAMDFLKDTAKWRQFRDDVLDPDGLDRINETCYGYLFMKAPNDTWVASIATPADTRQLQFNNRTVRLQSVAGKPSITVSFTERSGQPGSMSFKDIVKVYFGSYTFEQILENGGCMCDKNWNPLPNSLHFIIPDGNDVVICIKTASGIAVMSKISQQENNNFVITEYSISIPIEIINKSKETPVAGKARIFADECIINNAPATINNAYSVDVDETEFESWPDNTYKPRYGSELKRLMMGIGKYFGHPNKVVGNLNWINTSGCTYASEAFKQIVMEGVDISKWDMTMCENTTDMFKNAKCEGTLDLSNWKFKKGASMTGMFADAQIKNLILPAKIDFTGVPKYLLAGMFAGFKGSFSDISEWIFDKAAGQWTRIQIESGQFPFSNCEWAKEHPEMLPKCFQKYFK